MGVFADWQPRYAEHGIPTFPVRPDKKPALRNYLRLRLRGSGLLAGRFTDADAIGFVCGPSSGITVLDIDSPSEPVVAEALAEHGASPIIVRSGGGNHQIWYRYDGERRLIRPFAGRPIDVLGGGFVVAPPSVGPRRPYEFIQGCLDDLDRLQPLLGLDHSGELARAIGQGQRNKVLWRHCMWQAGYCDDSDALLDVARTFNERALLPPLDDNEVIKVATSAWGYTDRGENRFGKTGAWSPTAEVDYLVPRFPAAFNLLMYLRAHNRPSSEFMIANGLAEVLAVGRPRLAAARRKLIDLGFIEQTRAARQHKPALYRWGSQGVQNRTPILN
jgi:hypothetical protein